MTPLLPLLALGLGGIVLLLRKSSPSKEESNDPLGFGATIAMPVSPPAGFRRLLQAEVTPELTNKAKEILRSHGQKPIGTQVPFVASDGKNYLAIVEQHYHEPGGPLKPWGYHHGISLFVEKES